MSEPSGKNMMGSRAFLDAILPKEGLRCVATLDNHIRHAFFRTNEEAADFIDRSTSHAVYHACATYKTDASRKGANVLSAQALWVDIDLRSDKHPLVPYATVDEAQTAVDDFCDWHGLPDPSVVRSGGGLHVYWLLDAPLPPGDWKRYAAGLKAALNGDRFGVVADQSRTADIASILRPHGSWNRKDVGRPRQVIWDGNDTRHPLVLFDSFVEHSPALVVGWGDRPAFLDQAREIKPEEAITYDDRPSDPNRIADNCGHMSRMRETRGLLAEPLWRACLGVLAYAANGDRYAHEWSQGHEQYDAADTDARLARFRDLGGPITCGQFGGPECEVCPSRGKITTPLQLGRAERVASGVSGPVDHGRVPEAGSGDPPVEHPPGYGFNSDGALVIEKGEDKFAIVCKNQTYMAAISRLELNDNAHTFTFRTKHPIEGWREVTVGAEVAFGSTVQGAMGKLGVMIHDPQLFRYYVRDAAIDLQNKEATGRMFESYGWKDEERAFLVGNRLYSEEGVTTAPVMREAQNRAPYFKPTGSLDEWSGIANKLFAPGCESQRIALLASFAAPLMRFASGPDEGGCILSLTSRASSKGKTTALTGAYSIWGSKEGISINTSATEVARGMTMGALANLPIIFDEAEQRDAEELVKFVRVFTEGRDRQRGQVDGTVRQSAASWQTIMITGSNQPLAQVLQNTTRSRAMSYRVFEVEASLPDGLVYKRGDTLKNALIANRGNAGHKFMQYLMMPGVLPLIRERIERSKERIYDTWGLQQEHRFWIRMMAAIEIAGALAKHLGLVEFSVPNMMAWCKEQAQEQMQAGVNTNTQSAIEALAEFLNAKQASIVQLATAPKRGDRLAPHQQHRIHGTVYGRYEQDTGALYLGAKMFRTWLVENDYAPNLMFKELERMGIVIEHKNVALAAGTGLPSAPTFSLVLRGKHELFNFESITKEQAESNVVPFAGAR